MDVKPNYCSLDSVFSENTIYKVPLFQRAYSWTSENVEQFTQDIESLYKKVKENNSEDQHFLGGIVCVKKKNESILDEKVVYELVDGQQRLSTIVLFISRLTVEIERLSLSESQSELRRKRIRKYKSKYINFNSEENEKDVSFPRITLSRRDKDFYKSFVIDGKEETLAITSSQKLIKDAARVVDNWLSCFLDGLTQEQRLSESDVLFKVLSSSCKILMIKMSDVKDAYRLFQVINDRGRSLTAGDLLRAASLGIFDGKRDRSEQDLIALEEKWDEISDGGHTEVNNRLMSYYTYRLGKSCRKAEIFENFSENFFNERKTIKDEIENLYLGICLYKNILKGRWPYEKSNLSECQKSKLKNIVVNFKHTHSIPLLMSASQLKEKKFYEIIFYLEKFFFIFKVALEKRMTPVTKLYYSTILEINKSPNNYQPVWFLRGVKKILAEKVSDPDFENFLNKVNYVSDEDNKNLKYMLVSIEENVEYLKSGKRNPVLMFKKSFAEFPESRHLTIEHIYPKSSKAKHKDDMMEEFKNNIGNLTVLYNSENNSVADLPFEDKIPAYRSSRIKMTRELSEFSSFTEREYLERKDKLHDQIKEVFYLGEAL
ncbi:DUF262 domain-containing protein [Phytohalomonas tamaricis]|uniref:DUF262 domain-containing protein n=1 Tax=Phytohalomonas tamaricis TaxID=2081032 RepID=UPI000D0B53EA|nr:DUF262 domain-containing protein [Phytohalomonas tamaricis]